MIKTYEEAIKRIAELEEENDVLLSELEHYRSLKKSGRKKHNKTWEASYNDFAIKYEQGMSIMEIVELGTISRRTAYRYKNYYEQMCLNNKSEDIDD